MHINFSGFFPLLLFCFSFFFISHRQQIFFNLHFNHILSALFARHSGILAKYHNDFCCCQQFQVRGCTLLALLPTGWRPTVLDRFYYQLPLPLTRKCLSHPFHANERVNTHAHKLWPPSSAKLNFSFMGVIIIQVFASAWQPLWQVLFVLTKIVACQLTRTAHPTTPCHIVHSFSHINFRSK